MKNGLYTGLNFDSSDNADKQGKSLYYSTSHKTCEGPFFLPCNIARAFTFCTCLSCANVLFHAYMQIKILCLLKCVYVSLCV